MATKASEMSLSTVVRVLVASLHKQRVSLPFKNQKPWHLLFYSLKAQSSARGRPPFLDELMFDWDGPYPKCEELADFLNALHVTANVSALNPGFNAIAVGETNANRWSKDLKRLDANSQRFVTRAIELAHKEFQATAE